MTEIYKDVLFTARIKLKSNFSGLRTNNRFMVWLVHKETIYHDEIASSINIWEDGEYWAAQDFTELVDPASGIE